MQCRPLCLCLALFLLVFPLTFAKSSHHSSSSGSKPVHVRGYTKKDGTYVAPHDRGAPGTAPPHESKVHEYSPGGSPSVTLPKSYRRNFMAEGLTAHPTVQRDKHGKIKRSSAAKDEFKHEQPCPANGHTSGRCPGYVIDHVNPLECGGADAPSNMQWQTMADGKAKDKTERFCR